jgi:hypothetical protein
VPKATPTGKQLTTKTGKALSWLAWYQMFPTFVAQGMMGRTGKIGSRQAGYCRIESRFFPGVRIAGRFSKAL